MTKIDSANYYGMVSITGGSSAVNVIYDNIDYLGRSQIIYMGGNGGSTNSIMTFGNIWNDVVVNDRGLKIGTYDAVTGFGDGASIILEKTNTGSVLSGNAIDNFTTNTTGYDIGLAGAADVIFNLGKDTSLISSTNDVVATKNTGAAGIYIRNAGKIVSVTGIATEQNGSGNTVITNDGTIDANIGLNASQNGSGTLSVNNPGIIKSKNLDISITSSSANNNITVNNTGGTINASAGSGISVLNNAILNLIGGVIETTNAANAITISNNAAHQLSDLILNLNGTGDAIAKSTGSLNLNVTLANASINITNRIGLSDLSGLTFAASIKGTNTINVGGTGTGIATTNSAISALNAEALQVNVNGAGVGIATTGGV